jgi:predicted nuclease of predicted toxin-antitoxin system
VKFLVDNQLPRALATLLENFGHCAVHVLDIELSQVADLAIWAYAAQNGYTIISKDADFADLQLKFLELPWPASFVDPPARIAPRS